MIFKVTKEDVGRIAIDDDGAEWKLVHWEDGDEYPATWRSVKCSRVQTTTSNGTVADYANMVKWKPKEPRSVWVGFQPNGRIHRVTNIPFDGAVKFIEAVEEN